jgi:nitrogen fixation NifU-like protein
MHRDRHTTLPDGVSPRFAEHVRSPRCNAPLPAPSGSAAMTGVCGDSVEVQVLLHDGVVRAVAGLPTGCAYTVACASAVADLAQGLDVEQALALEPQDVARALGGLPEDHMHCARLAVNALGEALADACGRERDERAKPKTEAGHAHP